MTPAGRSPGEGIGYHFSSVLGGFRGGSDSKESACNTGDLGLITGLGRPLEEGMGTHSVFLPGESPWTEEPGGLQSMGSQRVGHDRATKHGTAGKSEKCC